jgi:hypothetical protein
VSMPQPAPSQKPALASPRRRLALLLGIPIVTLLVAVGVWVTTRQGPAQTVSANTSTSTTHQPTTTSTSPGVGAESFAKDWIRRVEAVRPPSTAVCDDANVRNLTCGNYIVEVMTVVTDMEKALPAATSWSETRGAVDKMMASARRYVDLGCLRGQGSASECLLEATIATNKWPVTAGLMHDSGLS